MSEASSCLLCKDNLLRNRRILTVRKASSVLRDSTKGPSRAKSEKSTGTYPPRENYPFGCVTCVTWPLLFTPAENAAGPKQKKDAIKTDRTSDTCGQKYYSRLIPLEHQHHYLPGPGLVYHYHAANIDTPQHLLHSTSWREAAEASTTFTLCTGLHIIRKAVISTNWLILRIYITYT